MESNLAIILCTKNGEEFLNHQLESIEKQDFRNFDLFISDDSSSDNTNKIISSFKKFKNKNFYFERSQ